MDPERLGMPGSGAPFQASSWLPEVVYYLL
jgi:hypothetical protein